MNECMEVSQQALDSCQVGVPKRPKVSVLLRAAIVVILLLALPGLAEAARQCPDGSPAGRGNLCPDVPLNDARWVGYSVPGQMVVGQTYATSAT